MNRIKWLSGIAGFLILLSLLVTVIDVQCFNSSFYASEYAKNQTAQQIGMNQEDLEAATTTLLDYLQDKRADIVVQAEVLGNVREVYNARETAHMIDVKALYQHAVGCRNIAVLLGVGILVWLLVKYSKSRMVILTTGYQIGMSVLGILVLFILVFALADFDSFWIKFHQLLFTNDLWLLDPNTSIMINMFTGSFFEDLVIRIIVWFFGISVALGAAIYLPWNHRKKAL